MSIKQNKGFATLLKKAVSFEILILFLFNAMSWLLRYSKFFFLSQWGGGNKTVHYIVHLHSEILKIVQYI